MGGEESKDDARLAEEKEASDRDRVSRGRGRGRVWWGIR
jgi:hypothetical protein